MKQLLKRWLGIAKLENEIGITKAKDVPIDQTPMDITLRRMVGDAISALASGEKDDPRFLSYGFGFDIPSRFENAMEYAAEKPSRQWAEKLIKDRIYTEKFIDEVVERIQRKQLPAKGAQP